MPLYVLALTDADLGTWTARDRPMARDRRLLSVDYGGIHVVYERRATAPPVTDEELRAQHAMVIAIAERAPAVLPARFGSLMQKRELASSIRRHEVEILSALQRVRNHVQMTVRVLGKRPKRSAAPASPNMSGREYLEHARRAATPPTTPEAERLLAAVGRLVATERREHGAGRLLATIYHLVEARHVERYRKAAGAPVPGVIVSGPWPPFAFSPPLW